MSTDLVVVETIHDPFTRGGSERGTKEHTGGSIADYWNGDPRWLCIWNGRTIESQDWSRCRPGPDDTLIFVPNVEGIGVAIATTLLAATLPGVAGAAVTTTAGIAALTIAGAIIDVGISVGAGLLANELFGAKDLGDSLLPELPKSVHTFDGIRTQAQVGAYIPRVFGKFKLGGNVIGNMIRSNFVPEQAEGVTDLTIYPSIYEVILALCEGPIVSIDEVLVNGNDISNYQGGGELLAVSRLGTPNQAPTFLVSSIGGNTNVVPVGLQLENDTDTYGGVPEDWRTSSMTREADSVYININHPAGLYFGAGAPHFVEWSVRFKPYGADEAEYSEWKRFPLLQVVGEAFQSYCQIDFPERGRYDLQVRKATELAAHMPEAVVNDIEWDSFTEISEGDFSFPNTALIAARMYQLDDLAGGQPTFVVSGTGTRIERYDLDAEEWVDDAPRYNNPAWVVIYILTSSAFGTGGNMKRPRFDRDKHFDLPNWVEFAEWCDELVDDGKGGLEPRCQFNGTYEGGEGLWESAYRALGSARAFFVRRGNKLGVQWHHDRPHTMLFNRKNMAPGSFKQKVLPPKKRINQYEVEFLNEDLSLALDFFPVADFDAIDAYGVRTKDLKLFGITSKSQAQREARWRLNIQAHADRVVSWKAPWMAVTCEVGDIVKVANEHIGWGTASGTIRGATASTVTIDTDFELIDGFDYDIEIQHQATDVLEVRTISSPPGTYVAGDTLTISEDWDAVPDVDSLYRIGEVTGAKHLVFINEIQPAEDQTFEIIGMRYDPRINDDTIATVDDPIDTEIPNPSSIPPCLATAPTLAEVYEGGETRLRVTWTYSPASVGGGGIAASIGGAKVYYRRTTGVSITTWQLAGQVSYPSSQFTINGLELGETYAIKVMQMGPQGSHLPPTECLASTITLAGYGPVPPAVTNVQATQSGPELTITWDPVTPAPLRYDVRRGESWVLSVPIGTSQSNMLTTDKFAPPLSSEPQVDRIWVRAVSASGLYGEAGSVELDSLALWFASSAAATYDGFTAGWSGTKTNLTVDGGTGFLELTDLGLPGTYETGPIDLGSISNFRVGAVPWARVTGGPAIGSLTETLGSLWAKRWGPEGPIDPTTWIASFEVHIRTATTSGGLTSAMWVPLTGAAGNFYGVRYAELRLTLSTSDADWEPRIAYLAVTAEALP